MASRFLLGNGLERGKATKQSNFGIVSVLGALAIPAVIVIVNALKVRTRE